MREVGDTAQIAALCQQLIDDAPARDAMAAAARAEAEKWGWEAATSNLRNVQYRMAMQNFRNKKALIAGVAKAKGVDAEVLKERSVR